MTTCGRCGSNFNIDETRSEYNAHFQGDPTYNDVYYGGDDVCSSCGIPETESNINVGRAIDMVNGDEDYDDDFVTHHL